MFVGYGDDSVAQLGGAHIACEWVSNVLTKVLQRPRLAGYLEQSTRYIAYDAPMPGGGYRYYRDASLGPEYERGDGRAVRRVRGVAAARAAWVDSTFPATPGESEAVRRRAVKAKALDLLRGLLPAASLSHMGIYASGQAYEQLILHLLAHPLPEARALRRADARGGQGRDPELRRARRAPRPRRRLGRLPERAPRGRAALGRAARAGPRRGGRRSARRSGSCTSTATRTGCSRRCSSRPRACPRSVRWKRCARSTTTSARADARRPRRRARRTAATARAAASRRCATASRSSPTTARSATCSATGCSPSSGSR